MSALLGSHIEMTDKAGEYYPIGSTYQPNEASLTLPPKSLAVLNSELEKSGKPEKITMNDLTVIPMNAFQKTLSNIARWITQ